jgi:hypothetical protein
VIIERIDVKAAPGAKRLPLLVGEMDAWSIGMKALSLMIQEFLKQRGFSSEEEWIKSEKTKKEADPDYEAEPLPSLPRFEMPILKKDISTLYVSGRFTGKEPCPKVFYIAASGFSVGD